MAVLIVYRRVAVRDLDVHTPHATRLCLRSRRRGRLRRPLAAEEEAGPAGGVLAVGSKREREREGERRGSKRRRERERERREGEGQGEGE